MKAMILAAGRGERMRPLTDHLPKPLLTVAGKPLIVHHIERLAAIGISDIVINIAYLGEKIRQALGDGSQWKVNIHYSVESEPLETAGALLHALPLLGDEPFLLVNGDVWTDIDFAALRHIELSTAMACLVLVNNPEHNTGGDFCLASSAELSLSSSSSLHQVLLKETGAALSNSQKETYTFSGIACIHPDLLKTYPHKRRIFPLKEVLVSAIEKQQLMAFVYHGQWCDVGTPERLDALNGDVAASLKKLD